MKKQALARQRKVEHFTQEGTKAHEQLEKEIDDSNHSEEWKKQWKQKLREETDAAIASSATTTQEQFNSQFQQFQNKLTSASANETSTELSRSYNRLRALVKSDPQPGKPVYLDALTLGQLNEHQNNINKTIREAKTLLADKKHLLNPLEVENLNHLLNEAQKDFTAIEKLRPLKKQQDATRQNLVHLDQFTSEVTKNKEDLNVASKRYSSLPAHFLGENEKRQIAAAFGQAEARLSLLDQKISQTKSSENLNPAQIKQLEQFKNKEIEDTHAQAQKQVDALYYPHIKKSLKSFLRDTVKEFPYTDKKCKNLSDPKNSPFNNENSMNALLNNFQDNYVSQNCSPSNEGNTVDLGNASDLEEPEPGKRQRPESFHMNFHALCLNGQKQIVPHSIALRGTDGKMISCDLNVARATMKTVYHAFNPLSEAPQVYIEKKHAGSLGLEQKDDSKPAVQKAQNAFDKNAFQIKGEADLEKDILKMGVYGKLEVDQAQYSDRLLQNAQTGVSYQNGLQKYGGINLNDRFNNIRASNFTKNKTLLNDPKLKKQCATQILRQVAKMTEAGIIHRDIKPANVLMDDSGNCRVMDFGSAVWTREDPAAKEKHVVLNGYNHTQEYLRWHSSKEEEYGKSDPKLSSQDAQFLKYEAFEKKVMEETQGKGILLHNGETPDQAILRVAKASGEDPTQFEKFVTPHNDHFQTGAVLALVLSGDRGQTALLMKKLRDPKINHENKNTVIEQWFKDHVGNQDKTTLEAAKAMLKTYESAPNVQLKKASIVLAPFKNAPTKTSK